MIMMKMATNLATAIAACTVICDSRSTRDSGSTNSANSSARHQRGTTSGSVDWMEFANT
jgi:hypothetical protein